MHNTAPHPALARVSATSVSRVLRRAGFLPVPDLARHEGIKVTRGHDTQHVRLNIDLPGLPSKSARWMADITEALTAAGYTVEWTNTELFLGQVTRTAPPTPAQVCARDGHRFKMDANGCIRCGADR